MSVPPPYGAYVHTYLHQCPHPHPLTCLTTSSMAAPAHLTTFFPRYTPLTPAGSGPQLMHLRGRQSEQGVGVWKKCEPHLIQTARGQVSLNHAAQGGGQLSQRPEPLMTVMMMIPCSSECYCRPPLTPGQPYQHDVDSTPNSKHTPVGSPSHP